MQAKTDTGRATSMMKAVTSRPEPITGTMRDGKTSRPSTKPATTPTTVSCRVMRAPASRSDRAAAFSRRDSDRSTAASRARDGNRTAPRQRHVRQVRSDGRPAGRGRRLRVARAHHQQSRLLGRDEDVALPHVHVQRLVQQVEGGILARRGRLRDIVADQPTPPVGLLQSGPMLRACFSCFASKRQPLVTSWTRPRPGTQASRKSSRK